MASSGKGTLNRARGENPPSISLFQIKLVNTQLIYPDDWQFLEANSLQCVHTALSYEYFVSIARNGMFRRLASPRVRDCVVWRTVRNVLDADVAYYGVVPRLCRPDSYEPYLSRSKGHASVVGFIYLGSMFF